MRSELVFEHRDPVGYLKEVFSEKSRANPKFSLRAFAEKLALSPGALHKILARQKKLSFERAHEVAKRLGLEGAETEYFVTLAQFENAKSESMRARLLDQLKRMNPRGLDRATELGIDRFKLVSDWYGLAVLELVSAVMPRERKSAPGQWTAAQIAKALGITTAQSESTLERLAKLDLLARSPDGKFARAAGSVLVVSDVPNEALRNYYRGVLDRCLESVAEQPPSDKVVGAEVFAFDPAQIEEVRSLTDDYLTSLRRLAQTGKRRTEVYQALTNVFRITKKGASK